MPAAPRFATCLLLGTLIAAPTLAQTADDRTLRYQPPSVDRVYPAEDDPLEEAEKAPAAASPGEVEEKQDAPPAANAAPVSSEVTFHPVPVPSELDASALEPEPVPEPELGPVVPSYGAQAVATQAEPGHKELQLADARDLPGVFGDPLRAIELMPGVVPISSGLPYFYSRGSPPANQGYRFDGQLLPQIFHVAVAPQVLHPRMVEAMNYYGAVAPADFGRRAGALVDMAPEPHHYRLAGEVDIRLFDVNGFIEAPVLGGDLQFATRYGGDIVRLLDPNLNLHFWDSQLRYELPLDADNRLQLVWLGSFDKFEGAALSAGPVETSAVGLHFQRLALRILHDTKRGELGAEMRFGYDDSSLGTALFATAFTVGPRVWYTERFGKGHRLSAGADMLAAVGDVRDEGGSLSGVDGQLQITLPSLAEASARNQGGTYAEVALRLSDDTRMLAGARADLWKIQEQLLVGFDPRLRVFWDVADKTVLHAAVGMAHQPAVFLLPLPGLSEVALSDVLTRSYQAEIGVAQELPGNVQVEVTPFVNYQQNLLLPELVVSGQVEEDPPLVNAYTYGLELFAKGNIRNRFIFMGSYTLGYATAISDEALLGKFSPDFDVRHVLNLSARYDFPSGFNIGLRLGARSGRMVEQQNPAYAQRLPWFTRLDARVGYAWRGRFGLMDAYLEVLNATYRSEYLDADCFFGQCVAESAPVITIPNLGVRATFD